MKNTDRISAGASGLARVPPFAVTPPPRCCTTLDGAAAQKCGVLASYVRRGGRWFGDSFHCRDHREPADLELAGDFVVRRVRVTCDILLAGVDERATVAHTEALARLAGFVAEAGGVLDVKLVTSQVGRYPAYGDEPGARPTPGSRE